MSLVTNKIPRVFKNGETLLPDPNPNLSPDEVMQLYANQYSELTNATCSGPKIENDQAVYEFKTTVGTKG